MRNDAIDVKRLFACVDKADLSCPVGVLALRDSIETNWTIREVLMAKDFLHGGTFVSDAGWQLNISGFSTSYDEWRSLVRLWESLVRDCYLYLGAAAGEGRANVLLRPGIIEIDPDNHRHSALDFTLQELKLEVGVAGEKAVAKTSDEVAAVEESAEIVMPENVSFFSKFHGQNVGKTVGKMITVEKDGVHFICRTRVDGKLIKRRYLIKGEKQLRFLDALLNEYAKSEKGWMKVPVEYKSWQGRYFKRGDAKQFLDDKHIESRRSRHGGHTGEIRLFVP